jgi:folate-binding protein YgfZ
MVSEAAYRAARTGAASIDRTLRGRIMVRGRDRASYLQGLLTNDIAALRRGTGCYAAYLTPQGRMITDLFVYELGDQMLLTVPGAGKDRVLAKLDQNVFTEDVSLTDVSGTFAQIAIVGPQAATVLGAVIDNGDATALDALAEHGNLQTRIADDPAVLVRVSDTGEPGFDLYVGRAFAPTLAAKLAAAGVVPLDPETADALRLEAGIPVFGRDMDNDTIPLEAGIEGRAISFTKGCYVGQEVIVRVLHRGHGRVARKLVGLTLDGSSPPPSGAVVRSGDREIGRVTSSTISPAVKKLIALAYLHRDFLTPGTVVAVDAAPAVVTELPFYPSGT